MLSDARNPLGFVPLRSVEDDLICLYKRPLLRRTSYARKRSLPSVRPSVRLSVCREVSLRILFFLVAKKMFINHKRSLACLLASSYCSEASCMYACMCIYIYVCVCVLAYVYSHQRTEEKLFAVSLRDFLSVEA